MRKAFFDGLARVAQDDGRVLVLTGDLGFNFLEPLRDRFPGRFFNAGVAEQNMTGVATGLAEAGFIPFVYSIVPFAVMRPYEFIRNGPIVHRLPVRIVGVGGGVEYANNGPTHYGLEDLGLLRTQPGIAVIAPADGRQARNALLATWDTEGPVYYRLGKDDRLEVPGWDGAFAPGRAETARAGADILVISTGAITAEAAAAADALAARGVGCELLVVASLRPAPVEDLARRLARHRVALAVESHFAWGGLGSLVAEVIAEGGIGCRLVRCAIRETPDGVVDDEQAMMRSCGISRDALVATALGALG